MARTDAQKRAVARASKKLAQARRTLGKEAAAITRRIGGGRSRSVSRPTITEVSKGVYRVRDPTTGKLVVTSSRSFAESIGQFGKAEATKTSKAEGGGRTGRATTRLQQELARRGQTIEQARISTPSLKQLGTMEQTKRAEAQRMIALRKQSELMNRGAREQIRRLKNARGERIVTTSVQIGKEKVFTVRNLDTGEFTVRQFGKRGRRVSDTTSTGGQKINQKEIIKDLRLSNLSPIVNDNGTVVRFRSPITGKTYPFTDAGISSFNKDIGKPGAMFKQYVKDWTNVYGMSKAKIKPMAPIPKLKDMKIIALKVMTGKKLTDKEAVTFYKKYDNINMQNAKALTIAGPVIGTLVPGGQIPGAAIWALGELETKKRVKAKSNQKLTLKEVGKIARDAAIMGAMFGAGSKLLKHGGSMIGKRVILGGALKNMESQAARAAINHGGVLLKFVGYAGKNFITTYFMKDMIGNVFDVTAAVKNKRFNSALRSALETGASIGGYIGGAKITGGVIKGGLFVSGRLKPTIPEFSQKKTQLDVTAKQLLSRGKVVLTRRGVYETGKGLSPRKDAWLDSKVKNPTKSVFWRFDKTLGKKDDVISPLPLFTKSKTGYLKMFKTNWNKNKGLSPFKRYLKTTAETPLVEDVVIRRVVNLKDIKNLKLRQDVIRQYATKGKLGKATQAKLLRNPKFGISDKNREFGFHDENEFVTRTAFKFKGRKDISWTYDPTLGEYVPVVESLKTANKAKNFISVLRKKKIITRTDAKFIADNYAIKTQFKAASILPNKHSYTHMKQVEGNILKLMNKYPQYNSYWKKNYGSVAKARDAMKQAMWHDIGKGESASQAFGTAHGLKVWNVWKAKLLPKGLKFKPRVAKAIKKHETLDPRKLWYRVQNRVKLITPEQKIVATADRLDLVRFGIKVDVKRLPLKDAMIRLGIKQRDVKFPSSFNKIIAKIKIDRGVTKSDLKKLAVFLKGKVVKAVSPKKKTVKYKGKALSSYRSGVSAGKRAGTKPPKNYNVKHKGNKKAYVEGYREGYSGRYLINYKTGKYKPSKRRPTPKRRGIPKRRPIKRPTKRPPKRPVKRPPKRPRKRPPKRPTRRPPRRPPKRPPRKPPRKKPPAYPTKLPKGYKKKTISKKVEVYYIKIKKKGRIVNLTPRPLRLSEAKDLLAWSMDRNLVRTAYFEPLGKAKRVVGLPPKMRGYFAKNKRKFRPYKIRVGKKKQLRNGFIEKRKYALDTKRELAQLKKARSKKKSKRTKKKK